MCIGDSKRSMDMAGTAWKSPANWWGLDWTVLDSDRPVELSDYLLSVHADRHAGDISFTVCFFSFFVCLQFLCNGYLRRGLTQGHEIWQEGRPGWVAGHLLFW